ncbi:MAG: autoinducer synthase [Roseinatronobacter sp.]|nr:autoinducer synthase [Roseinatronobacter sp.]
MIVLIDSFNKHQHSEILNEMFLLRASQSVGASGAVDAVQGGDVPDDFDRLDPAYIVGLDEACRVISCVRVLQTTGPHVLADLCYDLLQGEPPLRTATLWEATCFCVDTARLDASGQGAGSVVGAISAITVALLEYARDSGVEDIITVITPQLRDIFQQAGIVPFDCLGATAHPCETQTLVALLACTDAQIAHLRAISGLEGALFADDAHVCAMRAGGGSIVQLKLDLSDDIALYLLEQIDAAKTMQELQAAIALTRHMLEPGGPGAQRGTLGS